MVAIPKKVSPISFVVFLNLIVAVYAGANIANGLNTSMTSSATVAEHLLCGLRIRSSNFTGAPSLFPVELG